MSGTSNPPSDSETPTKLVDILESYFKYTIELRPDEDIASAAQEINAWLLQQLEELAPGLPPKNDTNPLYYDGFRDALYLLGAAARKKYGNG